MPSFVHRLSLGGGAGRPETSLLGVLLFLLASASSATGQMGPDTGQLVPYLVASGPLDNATDAAAVLFSEEVVVPGAPWLRVVLSGADLREKSFLRFTSLLDGEVQELDAGRLLEWQNASAFFNGSGVRIELVGGPQTTGNSVAMTEVLAGAPTAAAPETICGIADDRQPVPLISLPYVARLLSGTGGWCTGSIVARYDGVAVVYDGCLLSAGHCFSVNAAGNAQFPGVTVAQFNVPASGANCELRHPPVSKQFAIGPVAGFEASGIGNDWAVFRCHRNPVTNRTPHEEQCLPPFGACNPPIPVGAFPPGFMGGVATVPGYGADGGGAGADCNCAAGNAQAPRNAILQEDFQLQPYTLPLGPTNRPAIDHQSDTCPGNSGSPILENDQFILGTTILVRPMVGIHTHGGCDANPASTNSGTRITHPMLVAALANCQAAAPPVGNCPATVPYMEVSLPAGYVSIAGAAGEVVHWPPFAALTECGACAAQAVTDDDEKGPFPMPFPFQYFGAAAANFRVNSNGFLSIDGGGCAGTFANQPIGTASSARKIAPFWDDLTMAANNARVSHVVQGPAGNRVLTVQWENMTPFVPGCADNGERVSFQALLYELNHRIEFRYGAQALPAAGAPAYSASVGIANTAGTLGFNPTGLNGAANYVKSPLPAAFTTIAGNAGAVQVFGANVDDAISAAIALPAPFFFYGVEKNSMAVSANGFLTFDANLVGGFFTNAAIPNAAAPNDLVAPFWDDLHTGGTGSVWYEFFADNKVVVEWNDVEHFPGGNGSGETATFQAVLKPSPYEIEFLYDGASFQAGTDLFTATIGLENADATLSTDATGLGAANAGFGGAWRFTPPTQNGWNAYLPGGNYLFDPCGPCGAMVPFGPACAGMTIGTAGGAPTSPNAAFAITATGGVPATIGLLGIGLSNTLFAGILPLPIPLAALGFAGGCDILVDPGILSGAVLLDGAGAASFPLPIPPGIPSCSGPVYLQVFDVIPPATIRSSNGGSIKTG
ncbi:MAG TPA: nidogen-like domain-containing protein [Planctomycetota bacterium]|jgi:hypothetical protein|nr:nidogen-like domain-containing protein [Planctomycetota bacterium]